MLSHDHARASLRAFGRQNACHVGQRRGPSLTRFNGL
jgi:hypothetical protein